MFASGLPDEIWLLIADWSGVPLIAGTCKRFRDLVFYRYVSCHVDMWSASPHTVRMVTNGQRVRVLTVTFDPRWCTGGACEMATAMLSFCPGLQSIDLSFPEKCLLNDSVFPFTSALKKQAQAEQIRLRLHGTGIGDVGAGTLLRVIVGLARSILGMRYCFFFFLEGADQPSLGPSESSIH